MKTLLLAVTVLTLSLTIGHADSAAPTPFTLATVALRDGLQAMPQPAIVSTLPGSTEAFAQLGARNHSMPLSSGMALSMIALFVLALRLMGLNHARAMADHERDSYRGKAQMFRSLHDERSDLY